MHSIKMNKKALKFDNVEVKKKEFHKQLIALNLVNVNQTVVSDKFKHSDKSFKYFIGYKDDNIIIPLCIILPQVSGFIKYFDNGGKICPLWLKIITYWLNIMIFETKLKKLKT